MINYLFVCGQNKVRSKAAAEYFSELLQRKGIEGHVKSVGLYVISEKLDSWGYRSRRISKEMCEVADVIFVMEKQMSDKLVKNYAADRRRIVNLDILDIYYCGDIYPEWALGIKTEEEKKVIMSRPEIFHNWSLGRVLKERRLEQYIKASPSNLI